MVSMEETVFCLKKKINLKEKLFLEIKHKLLDVFADGEESLVAAYDDTNYIILSSLNCETIREQIESCLNDVNKILLKHSALNVVSVIIGVTNIIPFFGPFIGAVPCSILILLVSPMQCIYFVLFILVLQQFDGNILGPKILGDSTGISSFWVIVAILLLRPWRWKRWIPVTVSIFFLRL